MLVICSLGDTSVQKKRGSPFFAGNKLKKRICTAVIHFKFSLSKHNNNMFSLDSTVFTLHDDIVIDDDFRLTNTRPLSFDGKTLLFHFIRAITSSFPLANDSLSFRSTHNKDREAPCVFSRGAVLGHDRTYPHWDERNHRGFESSAGPGEQGSSSTELPAHTHTTREEA